MNKRMERDPELEATLINCAMELVNQVQEFIAKLAAPLGPGGSQAVTALTIAGLAEIADVSQGLAEERGVDLSIEEVELLNKMRRRIREAMETAVVQAEADDAVIKQQLN